MKKIKKNCKKSEKSKCQKSLLLATNFPRFFCDKKFTLSNSNFPAKTSLRCAIWNHIENVKNKILKVLFGPSVSLFVSVFSAWSYFTLLVFVSSSSFKVVKMCIRSTDHVSRLLKRLGNRVRSRRCKLYTTLLYYSFLLGKGLTSFYVRNSEPNSRLKITEFVLPLNF